MIWDRVTLSGSVVGNFHAALWGAARIAQEAIGGVVGYLEQMPGRGQTAITTVTTYCRFRGKCASPCFCSYDLCLDWEGTDDAMILGRNACMHMPCLIGRWMAPLCCN